MIYRIYVEKLPEYAVEAAGVLADIRDVLQVQGIQSVRILNRYDVDNLSFEEFERATKNVFSEPQVDRTYNHLSEASFNQEKIFAVEYLPGQFDQRASSAEQCIQILNGGNLPNVRFAKVYILNAEISDEEFGVIKKYIINPVEARDRKSTRLNSSH